jgi:hypothetical protein
MEQGGKIKNFGFYRINREKSKKEVGYSPKSPLDGCAS